MFVLSYSLFILCLASGPVLAFNFPFEAVQLQDTDLSNNSDLAFGNPLHVTKQRCKVFPGDAKWPSLAKWNALNSTLAGNLIKGLPPAAACYAGAYYDEARCIYVSKNGGSSLFVAEDPTTPTGQWQTGNSCPIPSPEKNYTCNFNGFPAYVIKAITVKDIQAGINFARNNNIRLVIKNTGHDFLGRNTGGGSLQIWTHQMKQFEYLPSFEMGDFKGQAARVGTAIQTFDLSPYMEQYNITLVGSGTPTVGAFGGWVQGGGHGPLTSYFGLGSDQVLSMEVVTPDGRFVHSDMVENTDLFWAIRGGGGSTFGIVTSYVIKAFPAMPVSASVFNFQTGPLTGNPSDTVSVSEETFWKGVDVYFSHMVRICDAKGLGWNYISPVIEANGTRIFKFINQVTLPGFTASETKEFVAPIIRDLNAVGVNLTNPKPSFAVSVPRHNYSPGGSGLGATGARFGSRLFPRASFENANSTAFLNTMASIRSFVEDGGYSFHSVDFTPTPNIAGYPGTNSAANPAFREGILHATGFDTQSSGPEVSPAQQIANHKRLNEYLEKWRAASPGAGAYGNEADVEEPNFQQSFYGYNYGRLLRIKKKVDPWGLFYAMTGVGGEAWKVQDTQGLPTQQGRLCRVKE
ncbi:FAD/FMN-containing isoamyl alcohol oxidase-like protein MreA [Amniculicola lignicola CBS 123094]|uniref:FAD/FMN-containing isoamyl alcohol oxidase-like protein MreA n=1 Tax=Amniculicola lignicola CBS 123094 TaxID=1392246 RepID=A0A6A5VWM8_9PLEO|nr:FAD/FMN-containing isoamyl alcohol oxidase-like protein MreA [Amniculicola lignicola CBS 123094]